MKGVNTSMKKNYLSHFLCAITGAACSAGYLKKKHTAKLQKETEIAEKMQQYFSLLNQWLTLKIDEVSLEKYFIDNNIKTIAIYGFGEIGKRFYEEMKKSNIDVLYIVDQSVDSVKGEIPVLRKTDILEKVDALVVTATYYFDEIEGEMSGKIDFPIISLEEVIYGI